MKLKAKAPFLLPLLLLVAIHQFDIYYQIIFYFVWEDETEMLFCSGGGGGCCTAAHLFKHWFQSWLRDYDSLQHLALILIYIQVFLIPIIITYKKIKQQLIIIFSPLNLSSYYLFQSQFTD
jgi:hypothetical protein